MKSYLLPQTDRGTSLRVISVGAKVAQERECTQLALREQSLPVCTLVPATGESHLPGVRHEQVPFDEAPPQPCLVPVVRLGVAQEEYVAQTDNTRTVILSQCVLVELGEGGCQAFLHLARQWSATIRPVDRHELRQLVCTLNHPRECLRDQTAMGGMTGPSRAPGVTLRDAASSFTDRALFQKFQWLAERTHPSDGFFNDSGLPLYLSLHNPTQTEFVTYDETTRPEQIAAVLQALEGDPPAYISLLPVTLGLTVRGDLHPYSPIGWE